jgi:hypothetical protein
MLVTFLTVLSLLAVLTESEKSKKGEDGRRVRNSGMHSWCAALGQAVEPDATHFVDTCRFGHSRMFDT